MPPQPDTREATDAASTAPSLAAGGIGQRLHDWAGSVLAGIDIVTTPPARNEPGGRWVGLYPMALASTAGTRGVKAAAAAVRGALPGHRRARRRPLRARVRRHGPP